jgi:hypothetical protein
MNAMMTLNAGLQAHNASVRGAGPALQASASPLANAVAASGAHAYLHSRDAAVRTHSFRDWLLGR